MPTIDDLRALCARLGMVEGWPTNLDGKELVERVCEVLTEADKDSCRSYSSIAKRITMRHRATRRVVNPSMPNIKWALKVLRARKTKHGGWVIDPGCPWEPKMPPPLQPAAQPKQGTLELVDEWI